MFGMREDYSSGEAVEDDDDYDGVHEDSGDMQCGEQVAEEIEELPLVAALLAGEETVLVHAEEPSQSPKDLDQGHC